MKALMEKINRIGHDDELMQLVAWYFIMLSLIFVTFQLRYSILSEQIGSYSQINYLFLIALFMLLCIKNRNCKETGLELCMKVVWCICLWIVLLSNYKVKTAKTVLFVANCMLPVLLILVQLSQKQLQRIMKHFLCVFNVFIVLLLVMALVEKFSGNVILQTVNQLIPSKEYTSYLYYMEVDVWRFYSLWGHALSNASLFNIFFVVNDLYHKVYEQKYPKIVYFAVALLGVLLCSSKTAIIILFGYFLFSSWKNRKLMFGCTAVVIAFLLGGGFKIILQRFMNTSLTTGRFDTFGLYLQSGLKPIRFFCGYGTGTTYSKLMYNYRAGFEFPLLMEALDYGVLFAILWLVGLYIYVSYRILQQRQYMVWLGFSVIYAQYNTYNGLALSNQDNFTWLCVISVILINLASVKLSGKAEEQIEEKTKQ